MQLAAAAVQYQLLWVMARIFVHSCRHHCMLAAAECGALVCGERVPTTPPAGVRSTSCPCLLCQPPQLLASSSISDVQESIAMLLTCKQFEVDGAGSTIRKMLPLIFSKDQGGWRGGLWC